MEHIGFRVAQIDRQTGLSRELLDRGMDTRNVCFWTVEDWERRSSLPTRLHGDDISERLPEGEQRKRRQREGKEGKGSSNDPVSQVQQEVQCS